MLATAPWIRLHIQCKSSYRVHKKLKRPGSRAPREARDMGRARLDMGSDEGPVLKIRADIARHPHMTLGSRTHIIKYELKIK